MSYVYIQSEPGLWTVGFYDPQDKWHAESDHSEREAAWRRVAYPNGGGASLHDLARIPYSAPIGYGPEREAAFRHGWNAALCNVYGKVCALHGAEPTEAA